jgi:hypothetical protein
LIPEVVAQPSGVARDRLDGDDAGADDRGTPGEWNRPQPDVRAGVDRDGPAGHQILCHPDAVVVELAGVEGTGLCGRPQIEP